MASKEDSDSGEAGVVLIRGMFRWLGGETEILGGALDVSRSAPSPESGKESVRDNGLLEWSGNAVSNVSVLCADIDDWDEGLLDRPWAW